MPEMMFAGSQEAQNRIKLMAKKQSKNVGSRDQNGRGVNYELITIATWKVQEKYHFCFVRQRVKRGSIVCALLASHKLVPLLLNGDQ